MLYLMDKIKIMKKITYLVLILGSLSLSAQTYQQYKKQKDYEQRYIREQRQKQQNQFNQKVITAFKNYAANMKKYEALVLKYKSVDVEMMKELFLLLFQSQHGNAEQPANNHPDRLHSKHACSKSRCM